MDRIKQLFSSEKSSKSLSRRSLSKNSKKSTPKNQDYDFQAEELSTKNSISSDSEKSEVCTWGLKYQQDRKTLILDLDNTLIFTSNEIPDSCKFVPITLQKEDDYVVRYVIKRPGMLKFLKSLSKIFNICVFTSAEATYARKVVEATKISNYIYAMYDRSHCNKINQNLYQKNIWSLGFDQKQSILIDDFDFQIECQPENCIQIKYFEGAANDRELYQLYPFLQKLSLNDDVRPVQKNLNEHMEIVKKSKEEKLRAFEESNGCQMDLDEGCRRSCVRAFETRPSMTKTNAVNCTISVY